MWVAVAELQMALNAVEGAVVVAVAAVARAMALA